MKSSVAEFCGKETYTPGDLSREVDARIKDKVAEFTGKDGYQFGDVSKEIEERRVAWVKDFTGKNDCRPHCRRRASPPATCHGALMCARFGACVPSADEFGDVTKKLVSSFTGKDDCATEPPTRAAGRALRRVDQRRALPVPARPPASPVPIPGSVCHVPCLPANRIPGVLLDTHHCLLASHAQTSLATSRASWARSSLATSPGKATRAPERSSEVALCRASRHFYVRPIVLTLYARAHTACEAFAVDIVVQTLFMVLPGGVLAAVCTEARAGSCEFWPMPTCDIATGREACTGPRHGKRCCGFVVKCHVKCCHGQRHKPPALATCTCTCALLR